MQCIKLLILIILLTEFLTQLSRHQQNLLLQIVNKSTIELIFYQIQRLLTSKKEIRPYICKNYL